MGRWWFLVVLVACADPGAAQIDAGVDPADAAPDARVQPECEWGGAPGMCMTAAACGAIPDHTAKTGACPAGQSCCIQTPDINDNPPPPAGWKYMQQAQVTADMGKWAVEILRDHVTYPLFATTTRMFGALNVLARVEWHPADARNPIVHRGVSLFVPK